MKNPTKLSSCSTTKPFARISAIWSLNSEWVTCQTFIVNASIPFQLDSLFAEISAKWAFMTNRFKSRMRVLLMTSFRKLCPSSAMTLDLANLLIRALLAPTLLTRPERPIFEEAFLWWVGRPSCSISCSQGFTTSPHLFLETEIKLVPDFKSVCPDQV